MGLFLSFQFGADFPLFLYFLDIFLRIERNTSPPPILKQTSFPERIATFQIIILSALKKQCSLPVFS